MMSHDAYILYHVNAKLMVHIFICPQCVDEVAFHKHCCSLLWNCAFRHTHDMPSLVLQRVDYGNTKPAGISSHHGLYGCTICQWQMAKFDPNNSDIPHPIY